MSQGDVQTLQWFTGRQLPNPKWDDQIGDPTLADAIVEHRVHNAQRIALKGESLRKPQAPDLTAKAPACLEISNQLRPDA